MNIIDTLCTGSVRQSLFQVEKVDRFRPISNAEIFFNSARLATAFDRMGVRRNDRIFIMSGPILETLEVMLACLRIGAVPCTADPHMGVDAFRKVVASLVPRICVFESRIKPEIKEAAAASCQHLIVVNPAAAEVEEGVASYDSLRIDTQNLIQPVECDDRSLALIVLTSGSQGTPKAIKFTHATLREIIDVFRFSYSQYCEEGSVPAEVPPFLMSFGLHHLAGVQICLYALMADMRVYLLRHFVPDQFLALIARLRCHSITLVPSMCASLVRDKELVSRYDLSSLKYCLSIGEPVQGRLVEEVQETLGVYMVSGYGLTECVTGIYHSREDLAQRRVKPGSVGKLLLGEARLVDDQGNTNESSGELWVRNSTAGPCYLDEHFNLERFENGWFKTRDVLHRDPDGYYFYRGRGDDMFVFNGKNIYPVDIEKVLVLHPSVVEVCATCIVNARGETVPAVMIFASKPLEMKDVVNFYIGRGAINSVPQVVKFTDHFPKNSTGKINRLRVKEELQALYDRNQIDRARDGLGADNRSPGCGQDKQDNQKDIMELN